MAIGRCAAGIHCRLQQTVKNLADPTEILFRMHISQPSDYHRMYSKHIRRLDHDIQEYSVKDWSMSTEADMVYSLSARPCSTRLTTKDRAYASLGVKFVTF